MFRVLIGASFLFYFCDCSSQSIAGCLRKSRAFIERGDYAQAKEKYLVALGLDSLSFSANVEYGLLLVENLNDPGESGIHFLRSEKLSEGDTLTEIVFGLARYYHSKDQYEMALGYYKRMLDHIDSADSDNAALVKDVQRNIENCRYGISNRNVNTNLRIVNLGNGVNTLYPEYVSVFTANQQTIVFTSRRKKSGKSRNRVDEYDGKYYEDMFIARSNGIGKFVNAHPISSDDSGFSDITNTRKHDAVVSLSYVNNCFYICRDGKIYESKFVNNSWSKPKLFEKESTNLPPFQTHLCMSSDGKTIYFSAENPLKSGDFDIFKSEILENGIWGPPVNLGLPINTTENEESPFLSEDGHTLYFSSRGHSGFGGYDVFKSTLTGNVWSSPVNLGSPINSSGDDIYLTLNENGDYGYVSSSRSGGFGDMDIYRIAPADPLKYFKPDSLQRVVAIMPDTLSAGVPISFNAFSSSLSLSTFSKYYWQVGDSVLPFTGLTCNYVFSDSGNYRLRLIAETEEGNLIGYEKNIKVSVPGKVNHIEQEELEPVYFGLNAWDIDSLSKEILNRNINKLKAKAGASIEIAAYTDVRGRYSYNQTLSEKRAHAIAQYMKSQGIKVEKTLAMGENDPLARCKEEASCNEEEYRISRRVEFKIMK